MKYMCIALLLDVIFKKNCFNYNSLFKRLDSKRCSFLYLENNLIKKYIKLIETISDSLKDSIKNLLLIQHLRSSIVQHENFR